MFDSSPEHRPVYLPVGQDQLQPVRYVFVNGGTTDFYLVNMLHTGGEPAFGVHVVPNPECRQQVVTWNVLQTSSRPVSEAGYGTTMTTHLPLVPEENLSRRDHWTTTQAALHSGT